MTNLIEEGSKVILYLGYNNLHVIKIKLNEVYQTKFGALKHNDLVGKEFGSKIICTKGYVHALPIIPELWTLALPHRTQILYMADISLILLELDIKPGSVVIEAGTGSGSLSHSIIRSLRPNGHLYTFEFHELRSKLAKNEFEEHGLSSFVTAQHRDVLSNGFEYENIADAVFLDLPAPWDAVEHVMKVLKKTGGRLCTFSPCIEQVQRTCQRLRTNGFEEINTVECLRRIHEFRYQHRSKIRFTADENQKEEVEAEAKIEETTDNKSMKRESTEDREELTTNKKLKNNSQTVMIKKQPQETVSMLTANGPLIMPGHTGYLTFAYLKQE
ncbi:unnamed protein product [Adineta steineri]|uniref:tRNA (adenine(58)-N(1))-methyltransferase catalytic subunit TRMT61A n=1 Tax=Adineta steineri TaxID=433720 RepID=A0A814BDY1_9BILA|nr:unnamed protein product [Adineta steineri]CAF0926265.1 unnamed protein product [Adineta steineri]